MDEKAFRNQRVRFRNHSPPYGDKVTWDPDSPGQGVRPRGAVPSRKNGRTVNFWTTQEYDAIVLFEASPDVAEYEERPARLLFRDGPRWYAYVPHFQVALESGRRVVVELSATGKPVTPRQDLVAEMVRGHLAAQGIRFVELPHWVMRARPRAADARKLLRPLLRQPSDLEVMKAIDVVAAAPAPLAEVEERSGIAAPLLLAMVRSGSLVMQGRGPIGPGTLLSRPDRRRRFA